MQLFTELKFCNDIGCCGQELDGYAGKGAWRKCDTSTQRRFDDGPAQSRSTIEAGKQLENGNNSIKQNSRSTSVKVSGPVLGRNRKGSAWPTIPFQSAASGHSTVVPKCTHIAWLNCINCSIRTGLA